LRWRVGGVFLGHRPARLSKGAAFGGVSRTWAASAVLLPDLPARRLIVRAEARVFFGPDLHFSDVKHAGIEGSEYELQTLTKKKLIDVLCSYEPDTVRDHYLARHGKPLA
jgi:hypothetical protein